MSVTPAQPPSSFGAQLGKDVYTGVAFVGRFQAVMGAIVGGVIAVVLILIGVNRLRDKHTVAVQSTVTRVACGPPSVPDSRQGGGTPTYSCSIDASYTYGGHKYAATGITLTTEAPIVVGAAVTLRVDPANPANAVHEVSPKALGAGLIAGGAIVAALAVGGAWLSFKSKPFAAVEGAAGLFQILR